MVRMRRAVDWSNVIKTRRTQLGMTQAQLADGALVSRQWLSGFENGKTTRSAKLSDIIALTDALGIDVLTQIRDER